MRGFAWPSMCHAVQMRKNTVVLLHGLALLYRSLETCRTFFPYISSLTLSLLCWMEWSQATNTHKIKLEMEMCYLIHLEAFIVSSRGKLLELFQGHWIARLILKEIWECFSAAKQNNSKWSSFSCEIEYIFLLWLEMYFGFQLSFH